MILTTCAACAAPLARTAPRCVRCHTRYCDSNCQHDHWRRGHKQICKKIHRGGNAEQYNADKKYKEALAAAVERCQEDTKGKTCYICMEGTERRHAANEGLVRGCACRGESGFAHVSCLAEQAKIVVEDAVDRKLGARAFEAKFARWHQCGLCGQDHTGVVLCALGWACWKTYVSRPETDICRIDGLNTLGRSLGVAKRYEESLNCFEAQLVTLLRINSPQAAVLTCRDNIATGYDNVNRHEEALALKRQVHAAWLLLEGPTSVETIRAAMNLAIVLSRKPAGLAEMKEIMRETIPVSQRALGPDHIHTLKMRMIYGDALITSPDASFDDCLEGEQLLESVTGRYRRIFGEQHPWTMQAQGRLTRAHWKVGVHKGEADPFDEPIPCPTM